jgi:L-threonylcarbamoyladenylate synthase
MAIKSNIVSAAASFLKMDDVVGIPTETVYGLAANALRAEAVLKIFEIKNRPHFDPLIVHIGNIGLIPQLTSHFPEKAKILARAFWPGPLTIILKKNPIIPDVVTSGLDTVGIRMPDHPLTLELLQMIDFPLAAPSANPFGYISPTTAEHVMEQLGEKIPMVLDGGECRVGLESTIIDLSGESPVILRLGGISVEEIEAHIGAVDVRTISTSNPSAPGMLISHYAPRKPFYLGNIEELLVKYAGQKMGILSYQKSYGHHPNKVLSPSSTLREAAKNLFAYMRELDALDVDLILGEMVPDEGIGRAINDKLRRADGSVLQAE